MKNLKSILLLIFGILTVSCDLEEDPISLGFEETYGFLETARGALDGVYYSMNTPNAMEARTFVEAGYSGFFITGRGLGSDGVNSQNNGFLFSLKPLINDQDVTSTWAGLYNVISNCNEIIEYVATNESSTDATEMGFNDIAGQAYFLRAWNYFSLVRLFGDIPLRLSLSSVENLHQKKSPAKDVYAQIIADAKMGARLMNGSRVAGYPMKYAANMLLSKVYMTLATNLDLQAAGINEAQYWQLAYEQAKEVYGQYSLVPDYSMLFSGESENSSESIFEFQLSESALNSRLGRNFTPGGYKKASAFGWLQAHADVYDDHVAAYPNDPRLTSTFISSFINVRNGKLNEVYPFKTSFANLRNAHPFLFKHAVKDVTHDSKYDGKNLIIYRYADLLIMLAEISNELQNGEQLGYITEVLSRADLATAGVIVPAAYNGSKEDFREAIMKEYRYELLGEFEDSHNNRRRGYAWFLKNTIEKHNSVPKRSTNKTPSTLVDLTLSTVESEVMKLKIPLSESNSNELID
ncbi:MAG: SusD-like protein [Formosa sp. Hel1_33_131]|nr:MAG: SusD-like protein [Formosa sp. Hel1_33_131]